MNSAPRTGQEAYPTMQAEHWQQIEDLYQATVAQPPEHRAEFIEQACPGDPQLRAEVETLLKNAGERTSFLGGLLTFGPSEADAGAVIGAYHLLQLIGQGGMGEVWLAHQQHIAGYRGGVSGGGSIRARRRRRPGEPQGHRGGSPRDDYRKRTEVPCH